MSRILRTLLKARNCSSFTGRGLLITKFSIKKYSTIQSVVLDKRLECTSLGIRCFSSANTFGPYKLSNNRSEDDQITSNNEDCLVAVPQNVDDLLMEDPNYENLLPSQRQKRSNDLLLQKIYGCQTAHEIFRICKKHEDVMSVQHHLATVRQLNNLVTKGDEEAISLHAKAEFRDLCSQLYACCRQLEVDELVSLLKHFCRLQVAPESKLMQTILQMLRHNLNDLELKQMVFLEFLLRKMPLTTLSDALLTALPILIDNGIKEQEIKELTLMELTKTLALCVTGAGRNTGMVLREIFERGSIRKSSTAVTIIWNLTNIHVTDGRRNSLAKEDVLTREVLMKECLETVAKDLYSVSHQKIETTLSKLCEAYENQDHCCYNENFLHAVSIHAVHEHLSFEKIAHLLRKLLRMNYLSEDLVHHMVNLVLECPETVLKARIGVLPLLASIAACEYHPRNLNDALDILLDHRSVRLDTDYFKKPLLRIALHVLSVGHCKHKLMELLTDPDNLSMYMSRFSKESAHHRQLLMIDQALGDVCHSSARVPERFLENGRNLVREQQSSRSNVKFMLQQIVNDPSYLISGFITDNDIYVDHLLVVDEEGQLVKLRPTDSLTERNISIDSLEIPENYKRIAILDIGSSYTFRPGDHLNGFARLKQKLLKARGFTVIVLLQSVIFRHVQEEKILFVERELLNAGVIFR